MQNEIKLPQGLGEPADTIFGILVGFKNGTLAMSGTDGALSKMLSLIPERTETPSDEFHVAYFLDIAKLSLKRNASLAFSPEVLRAVISRLEATIQSEGEPEHKTCEACGLYMDHALDCRIAHPTVQAQPQYDLLFLKSLCEELIALNEDGEMFLRAGKRRIHIGQLRDTICSIIDKTSQAKDDLRIVVVNQRDVFGYFNSYGAAEAWAKKNVGPKDKYVVQPLTVVES